MASNAGLAAVSTPARADGTGAPPPPPWLAGQGSLSSLCFRGLLRGARHAPSAFFEGRCFDGAESLPHEVHRCHSGSPLGAQCWRLHRALRRPGRTRPGGRMTRWWTLRVTLDVSLPPVGYRLPFRALTHAACGRPVAPAHRTLAAAVIVATQTRAAPSRLRLPARWPSNPGISPSPFDMATSESWGLAPRLRGEQQPSCQ